MTETMNIHKALSEVKILNDRITDKIAETKFCISNKVSNKTIDGKSIEEWKNNVKAAWDSVNTLILRRAAIKRAISKSNAATMVTIDGKEYSVAEAIEMKQYGIMYHEELLRHLIRNFGEANAMVERINADADDKATEYAKGCTNNKDGSTSADVLREIENIRKNYFDNHKAELIDPLDSAKKIEEIKTFIDKFKAEVDSVLSVSNATTEITIEY